MDDELGGCSRRNTRCIHDPTHGNDRSGSAFLSPRGRGIDAGSPSGDWQVGQDSGGANLNRPEMISRSGLITRVSIAVDVLLNRYHGKSSSMRVGLLLALQLTENPMVIAPDRFNCG